MALPIRVWLAPPGPNPWKVIVVLEELQVPYEIQSIRFEEIKQKPFTDLNPNGRVPAIQDPNTNLTLWETGAILTYLVEQYDTRKFLTYESLIEKHHLNQWLYYQASGQGPYFGQAGWFQWHHSERLPSTIKRYASELKRVLGVVDGWLVGKQWLVGDKITFVDLAWAPWNDRVGTILGVSDDQRFDGFPNVKAWHDRITSRVSWKKAMETRERLVAEQNLSITGVPDGETSLSKYLERNKDGDGADDGK